MDFLLANHDKILAGLLVLSELLGTIPWFKSKGILPLLINILKALTGKSDQKPS